MGGIFDNLLRYWFGLDIERFDPTYPMTAISVRALANREEYVTELLAAYMLMPEMLKRKATLKEKFKIIKDQIYKNKDLTKQKFLPERLSSSPRTISRRFAVFASLAIHIGAGVLIVGGPQVLGVAVAITTWFTTLMVLGLLTLRPILTLKFKVGRLAGKQESVKRAIRQLTASVVSVTFEVTRLLPIMLLLMFFTVSKQTAELVRKLTPPAQKTEEVVIEFDLEQPFSQSFELDLSEPGTKESDEHKDYVIKSTSIYHEGTYDYWTPGITRRRTFWFAPQNFPAGGYTHASTDLILSRTGNFDLSQLKEIVVHFARAEAGNVEVGFIALDNEQDPSSWKLHGFDHDGGPWQFELEEGQRELYIPVDIFVNSKNYPGGINTLILHFGKKCWFRYQTIGNITAVADLNEEGLILEIDQWELVPKASPPDSTERHQETPEPVPASQKDANKVSSDVLQQSFKSSVKSGHIGLNSSL